MGKIVTANGHDFEFEDTATEEQIGSAIDEFFKGEATPDVKKNTLPQSSQVGYAPTDTENSSGETLSTSSNQNNPPSDFVRKDALKNAPEYHDHTLTKQNLAGFFDNNISEEGNVNKELPQWHNSFDPETNKVAKQIQGGIEQADVVHSQASEKILNNQKTQENIINQINNPNTPQDVKEQLAMQYKDIELQNVQNNVVATKAKLQSVQLNNDKQHILTAQQNVDNQIYNMGLHPIDAVGNFVTSVYNGVIPSIAKSVGMITKLIGEAPIANGLPSLSDISRDVNEAGVGYLQKEIEKEQDPAKKAQLQKAQTEYAKLQPVTDVVGDKLKEFGNDMTASGSVYHPEKHELAQSVGGLVGTIAQIALGTKELDLGAKGAQVLTAITFGADGANNAYDEATKAGLKGQDRTNYTLVSGLINGSMVALPAGKFIESVAGEKLASSMMKETLDKVVKGNLTGDAIFDAAKETIKDKGLDVAKETGKSLVEAGVYGLAQGTADYAKKKVANKVLGRDAFEAQPQDIINTAKEMMTGIGIVSLFTHTLGKVGSSDVALYDKVVSLGNNQNEAKKFNELLDAKVKAGNITPEQAIQVGRTFKAIQEADKSIPTTITDKAKRIDAINLIAERNNLAKENVQLNQAEQSVDEAMRGGNEKPIAENSKRIEEINSQLKNIANDKTNNTGVQGGEREGQNIVQDQLDQSGSTQEIGANRVVQSTPEEVDNNSILEKNASDATEHAKKYNIELTPDEADHVAVLMHSEDLPVDEAVVHVIDMRDHPEHQEAVAEEIKKSEFAPKEPKVEESKVETPEGKNSDLELMKQYLPDTFKDADTPERLAQRVLFIKEHIMKDTKLSNHIKLNLYNAAESWLNKNKTEPKKPEVIKQGVVGSGGGGDVENTAKALEEVAKTKPTLWEKIKEAVKNVGKKLGIISNADHINNFNTAKAEWDKLSSREKKLKRADYELDDLHHTEGGYYKVGNSLIDLDLNSNHLKLLLENNKFLNVLNKLGVTKIHGENRPAEEMFAHYSDGKIHLNNNSAFENIRQVTNAMSHELGHHEWTKLTKEERDYVRSLPLETGMAKHYEAQEKSGKGKETSASLQEENFADYVMQYFQGKLYGDEALLNKIPTKLRELFDNKYSDLLKDNEHSEIAEAYHKAKADGTNPELVKAVEQSLPTQEVKGKVVGSGGGGDVKLSEKDLQDNGVSFIKGASHLAKENGISNEAAELQHTEAGNEIMAIVNDGISKGKSAKEILKETDKIFNDKLKSIPSNTRGVIEQIIRQKTSDLPSVLKEVEAIDAEISSLREEDGSINKKEDIEKFKELRTKKGQLLHDAGVNNNAHLKEVIAAKVEVKGKVVGSGVGGNKKNENVFYHGTDEVGKIKVGDWKDSEGGAWFHSTKEGTIPYGDKVVTVDLGKANLKDLSNKTKMGAAIDYLIRTKQAKDISEAQLLISQESTWRKAYKGLAKEIELQGFDGAKFEGELSKGNDVWILPDSLDKIEKKAVEKSLPTQEVKGNNNTGKQFADKIAEKYVLPDNLRLQAMQGADSNMSVKDWAEKEMKLKPKVIEPVSLTSAPQGGKKEGFTESKDMNRMYADLKKKYGDKKGANIYSAADRLVNPNTNEIIEIRGNGVVVKEGNKYILKPFTNTDFGHKKWALGKGLDVSDQFNKTQETKPAPLTNEVSKPETPVNKEEKETISDDGLKDAPLLAEEMKNIDINDELPIREKKRIEFVEKHFDSLVAQLMLKNVVKRKCP